MDGRRARFISPVLDSVPRLTRARQRPARVAGSLTTAWAAVLGVGWPIALSIATAVEPAPAQPDAAPALTDQLISLALLTGLVLTCVAAASRLRSAAVAGTATGLGAFGLALACPVTGHHQFGLWWIAQLCLVGGMLAVSLAALGSRATTSA